MGGNPANTATGTLVAVKVANQVQRERYLNPIFFLL
jgi:hypothetical protein